MLFCKHAAISMANIAIIQFLIRGDLEVHHAKNIIKITTLLCLLRIYNNYNNIMIVQDDRVIIYYTCDSHASVLVTSYTCDCLLIMVTIIVP